MSSRLDRIEAWAKFALKNGGPEDKFDDVLALVNVAKAAEDIRPYSPDEIRPGASATTYLIPTDRVERLRLSLAVLHKAGGK